MKNMRKGSRNKQGMPSEHASLTHVQGGREKGLYRKVSDHSVVLRKLWHAN